MNNHLGSLLVCPGIFFLFCLSLIGFSSVSHGDEAASLISGSKASVAQSANEASALIDTLRNKAARELAPAPKIAASYLLPSASAVKRPKREALKDLPLPHEGKGKCKDASFPGGSQGLSKCPSSLFKGMGSKQAANSIAATHLLIFVSESVPAGSVKELWNQANRVGGKLLFRGLVGGSFKKTQNYIQELGIIADIDPTKFDEFEIFHVPAFVLSHGRKYDKMAGNISLGAFLEQSGISGDLKKEAARLYKKLQGGRV